MRQRRAHARQRVVVAREATGPRAAARAASFPCPGCGRQLPLARRQDPDFTVCGCCKLDRITAAHRGLNVDYASYLLSPAWAWRRHRALVDAGYTCIRCGALSSLEVHHKHYRTLGAERPEHLEVLCGQCHPVADRARESETEANRYAARLEGWARKVYGDDRVDWDVLDWDAVTEEFEDWLDRRDD